MGLMPLGTSNDIACATGISMVRGGGVVKGEGGLGFRVWYSTRPRKRGGGGCLWGRVMALHVLQKYLW